MRRRSQLVIAALLFCWTSLYAQDAATAADQKTSEQIPARSQTVCHGPIEILSNTMGVDFGHYAKQILKRVRRHWYKVIPEAARPPVSKKGVVGLEFAIEKDGQVKGSKIVTSSGDASLDRAAWAGFTASIPFPRLPSKFEGEYIAIRFCFFYNPDKSVIASQ